MFKRQCGTSVRGIISSGRHLNEWSRAVHLQNVHDFEGMEYNFQIMQGLTMQYLSENLHCFIVIIADGDGGTSKCRSLQPAANKGKLV